MNRPRSRLLSACVALLLGAIVLAFAAPAHAEPTGVLSVTAVDFNNDQGQAVVGVYRRGKSWLAIGGAFRVAKVAIKNGKVSTTFKDLPHDEYAVAVVHDRNLNGKLDMSYVPYPSPEEGGGVSNNWIRSGKPEYGKAKFQLARALMSVRISMRY